MTLFEQRGNFPTEVENQQEGVWREELTQLPGSRRVTFRKPVPMQLIEKYADLAVRRADVVKTEDGTWSAEIPGMPGVWSDEKSIAETIDVLREVVFDWALVKIESGDTDLPILDDIDLNAL